MHMRAPQLQWPRNDIAGLRFILARAPPVNLSFFVMIATALVGAFAAEFQPRGLAHTMLGVATIQLVLGIIVSTGPVALREPNGPWALFVLNSVFVLLWLTSATLFRNADRAGFRM